MEGMHKRFQWPAFHFEVKNTLKTSQNSIKVVLLASLMKHQN